MAFTDKPIVDKASINSEKSVLAVKNLFLQENGFICRTIFPDFGVDENVELIIFNEKSGNQEASNKFFPLQLKSVDKKDKFITKKGIKYIKLQFKTSRLGYLLRRPPAHGILIIYDDNTGAIYYDYAEELHNRLNDLHGNNSWKKKDKPLIYIPTENILNEKAVKSIHKRMVGKHKNAQFLYLAHGPKYGLSVFEDAITKGEIDFKNPKERIKYLEKNGLLLIDSHEFNLLQNLISSLSISEILDSKDLLLIAAIVNCETGNFIDADFYLKKSNRINDYNDIQQEFKSFVRYKVDFAFGNFDNNEYLSKLENQLAITKGEFSKIIIQINIVYLKLFISTNKNIIVEIKQIFDNISKADINQAKRFTLINHNALNLHTYAMDLLVKKIGNLEIKESLNISIPLAEKRTVIQEILKIISFPEKYTLEASVYADQNNDKYLLATSLFQLSYYFFQTNLYLSLFDYTKSSFPDEVKRSYEISLEYTMKAYDNFLKLLRHKEAYNALTLAGELSILFHMLYKENIGLNKLSDIELEIKSMEKQLGLEEYKSVVKKAFVNKDNLKNIVTN